MADHESTNGRDRLQEAMRDLARAQMALVASVAESNRARVEYQRQHLELERESERCSAWIDERFARIMALLDAITRVLNRHTQMLEAMPDAICKAIAPYVRREHDHGRIDPTVGGF